MGSAIDKSVVRGLLVPDFRIDSDSVWAAESNYTTASEVAGIPVANQETGLTLSATGSLTAALDVQLAQGGNPGVDGATFLWKRTTDSAGSYIGWDAPQMITQCDTVVWEDGGDIYENIHAVTLAGGWVLVAAERNDTGAIAYVRIFGRDPADGSWSQLSQPVTVATTYKLTPCLVAMPDGRVLLYYHDYDSTTGAVNIAMRYSEDEGATWSTGSTSTITDTTLDTTASELRVAYYAGEFLMLRVYDPADASDQGEVQQYASSDGHRFQFVADSDETALLTYGLIDLIASQTGFVFSYCLAVAGGGEGLYVNTGSNAFQTIISSNDATYINTFMPDYDSSGKVWGAGVSSLAQDEDGTIYIVCGSEQQAIWQSVDRGVTFELVSSFGADGQYYCVNTAGAFPSDGKLIAWRGRMLLLSSCESVNASNPEGSIFSISLGGYSDVSFPLAGVGDNRSSAFKWYRNWLPFDLPDETATFTQGGTGSAVIDDGALEITATAPNSYHYDSALTNVAQSTGLVAQMTLVVPTAGDDGKIFIAARTSSTNTYAARVEATAGVINLIDGVSGSTIATAGGVGTLGGLTVQMLLSIDDTDDCVAWYRIIDGDHVRDWVKIGESTGLTSGAASTNRLRWGYEGKSGGGTGLILDFCYQSDEDGLRSQLSDFSNPDSLTGRPLSTSWVYAGYGGSVAGSSGPGYRGDSWEVPTRSDYAIENIIPSVQPSPRVPWRSSTTTANMTIAFDLDDSASTPGDSLLGNQLYGVYLAGINFREFDVEVYSGGSWSLLANVDCSRSVSYIRRGNTVQPSTSAGTTGRYILRDELVGGWFEFVGGALRKIIGNTEGAWIAPANGKTPTLYLEGVTGAEGTAIATGRIWFPRILTTILLPSSLEYKRGIRLKLRTNSSPAPADGYFEIGQACIGPVTVWGLDYENRSRAIEPNVEVTTLEDGTRRTRVLGPPRRRVEMSWPNGIPTRHLQGSATNDNWISPAGETYPIAARHDIADLLHGLIEQLDGPALPVVYLPYVETGEDTTYREMRQYGALYGRLMGGGQIDTVNGDEYVDEFVRVGTITIEEEL